jgi:hypothetical protein
MRRTRQPARDIHERHAACACETRRGPLAAKLRSRSPDAEPKLSVRGSDVEVTLGPTGSRVTKRESENTNETEARGEPMGHSPFDIAFRRRVRSQIGQAQLPGSARISRGTCCGDDGGSNSRPRLARGWRLPASRRADSNCRRGGSEASSRPRQCPALGNRGSKVEEILNALDANSAHYSLAVLTRPLYRTCECEQRRSLSVFPSTRTRWHKTVGILYENKPRAGHPARRPALRQDPP